MNRENRLTHPAEEQVRAKAADLELATSDYAGVSTPEAAGLEHLARKSLETGLLDSAAQLPNGWGTVEMWGPRIANTEIGMYGFVIRLTPNGVAALFGGGVAVAGAIGLASEKVMSFLTGFMAPIAGTFAGVLAIVLAAKAGLIWTVAGSGSCDLYSPWPMPGAFIPIAPESSTGQYFTTYASQNLGRWSDGKPLPFTKRDNSTLVPELVKWPRKMFTIFHRYDDANLYYTRYDPKADTLDTSYPVPHVQRPLFVGATTYRGDLHMVFSKSDNQSTRDKQLWHAQTVSDRFTEPREITPHIFANGRPALAEYNDGLYCVVRAKGEEQLYLLCWVGGYSRDWAYRKIDNAATVASPAVAVFQDRLHLVFLDTDGKLRHFWFDGRTWTENGQIHDSHASKSPSLVVYKTQLWCMARGGRDEYIHFTFFDGSEWSEYRGTQNKCEFGISAINYMDPSSYWPQIFAVYR